MLRMVGHVNEVYQDFCDLIKNGDFVMTNNRKGGVLTPKSFLVATPLT